MKLIEEHIQQRLPLFTNRNSVCEDIINSLKSDCKNELADVVCYLDNVLNETLFANNNYLSVLSLHLDVEFTESQKMLIAEYLLIKTFKHYESADSINNKPNLEIKELISSLEARQNGLEMRCPEGASGKNGGNRIWKNWVKDKRDIKSLLFFYNSINENSLLKFKSIFNTQKNYCRLITKLFEWSPFAIVFGSKCPSYNLLNSTCTLNEVDNLDNTIIDELDFITIFDCERKSVMRNYSFDEISKWNSEYGTKFKNYLIITFGKDYQSINIIRNKIDTIRERYKIPPNKSYTIISPEINFLLKKKEKSCIQVEFWGVETSSFWDTFLLETSIRDLYELRSIKLMNIYSICISDEIKNYILEDLFSTRGSSELITHSTKNTILEFSEEDIRVLKESISLTLDLIIKSEIKAKIIEKLSYTSTVILDESIIRNTKLISKFTKYIGISKSIKLKSWSELTNDNSSQFLILSYRDQGKYPNCFYPNLLETHLQSETNAFAILPKLLFANNYSWSKYNLLKDYHKYLSHSIRYTHFNWNKLNKLIQTQKPEIKMFIDWNLENEYSSSENRETYRVKLLNQRAKTYLSSDLLIFTESDVEKPRIERVKLFFENVDLDETKFKIQKLDELLNEFNPAERLIDTTQQELELKIIRKQLGLENESAGRIWKVLLRRKSESVGVEPLFEELKMIFSNNNIALVKFSHFCNSWLNPESDTLMPRGNKVVRVLFDYLNLINNYRLILYRLKNASISGKIEATKKYSTLLKDLFADGCFDDNVSLKSLIQTRMEQYRKNHSLEELGIDNEDPLSGLVTLVELVKPELNLQELETIERNKL